MAELPTDGGSEGIWAALYNAYLLVHHNADGTHKAIFGTRGAKTNGTMTTPVQVSEDSDVTIEIANSNATPETVSIFSDSGSNPTTLICRAWVKGATCEVQSTTISVKKDEYFKVTRSGANASFDYSIMPHAF